MFARIPVSNKFAMVDKEDLDALLKYKWTLQNGYAISTTGKFMHRLIMNPEAGKEVDHINGNRLNNMKSNLRNCTRQENTWNSKAQGERKYKGITEVSNRKYRVRIMVDGKTEEVGTFKSLRTAITAYNEAAIDYYGDFARLNIADTKKPK